MIESKPNVRNSDLNRKKIEFFMHAARRLSRSTLLYAKLMNATKKKLFTKKERRKNI